MAINKINENDHDKIAGGATYRYGNDSERPYEVIDDESGEVVLRCHSMGEAKSLCKTSQL